MECYRKEEENYNLNCLNFFIAIEYKIALFLCLLKTI